MSALPPFPWAKGEHEDYSALVVEITVCQSSVGQVFSAHELQDQGDQRVAATWRSGGQTQIAFAMLTEAVRREAILDLLMKMTEDPEFLVKLQEASEAERQARFQKLGRALRKTMNKFIEGIADTAIEEAYLSMVDPD